MAYRSMEEVPVILSVDNLAEILNISRNTAYDLVRSKKIPSKRVWNQIRITKSALEAYLAG